MKNIITITNLHKSYDNIKAVDGISLNVENGEMFGLVGPDGAGKTTTIRILCGLLGFDEGQINILEQDIKSNKNDIQKNIGYLSQKFSLYRDLSIDENIEFFAEIHNVTDYEKRRNDLLEFTRLTKFRDRLADNLSGGMRGALRMARAMATRWRWPPLNLTPISPTTVS